MCRRSKPRAAAFFSSQPATTPKQAIWQLHRCRRPACAPGSAAAGGFFSFSMEGRFMKPDCMRAIQKTWTGTYHASVAGRARRTVTVPPDDDGAKLHRLALVLVRHTLDMILKELMKSGG